MALFSNRLEREKAVCGNVCGAACQRRAWVAWIQLRMCGPSSPDLQHGLYNPTA